jgi:hypothetical protein
MLADVDAIFASDCLQVVCVCVCVCFLSRVLCCSVAITMNGCDITLYAHLETALAALHVTYKAIGAFMYEHMCDAQ